MSQERIDEPLIREIVRRVLDVTQPDRIIIFGSAVRGQMTDDSDIDVLILEQSPEDVWEEQRRVSQALRGLDFPFDVIVMSSARFLETKDVIGGIAYPAHKYGQVVYEAA